MDRRSACAALCALGWIACGAGEFACIEDERGERLRGALEEIAPDALSRGTRSQLVGALAHAECELEVNAFLLLAVAERESGFDPAARGPAGGIGLLQVRAATAAETARLLGVSWKGEHALRDVSMNVKIGSAYLARLREEFGTWEAALAAYNLGPTRLRSRVERGKPASSAYARAILARFRKLEAGP